MTRKSKTEVQEEDVKVKEDQVVIEMEVEEGERKWKEVSLKREGCRFKTYEKTFNRSRNGK